ncbi:hypothetical protein HY837_03495 [archaeon]|nr:hypothetical protein [archaeon]
MVSTNIEYIKKNLPAGELRMKLPGTDIVWGYSSGRSWIAPDGFMGGVILELNSVKPEKTDDKASETMEPGSLFMFGPQSMRAMGKTMQEKYKEPRTKEEADKLFVGSRIYLNVSRIVSGRKVLTLPFIIGDQTYDHEFSQIVHFYSLDEKFVKKFDASFNVHMNVIGHEMLNKDKQKLTETIEGLINETQQVYDDYVELLKRIEE